MHFSNLVSTVLLLAASSSVLAHPSVDPETTTHLAERELEERASSPYATVYTTCKSKGKFAMTFDDGPYLYGGDIANTIKSYGGLATFFVNGNNWDCIYDRANDLKARYAAGHVIGAHTWGHDHINSLTAKEFTQQLDLLETALGKILGIKPRFFRPPYGEYNKQALKILKSRGYTVVTWNVDSGDSDGFSVTQSKNVYSSLYGTYPTSYIALNHETYSSTAYDIVNSVVPQIVQAGYKLVTVSECLGVSPYQKVFKPSKKDKTWTCKGTPAPGQA
ncbi:putative chitin deacetylase [Meredithblackwellia eburnea MCA 4105]